MPNVFSVTYVTTLPKQGNSPKIKITGDEIKEYRIEVIEVIDDVKGIVRCSGHCITNQIFISQAKQWYTNWLVRIYDNNNILVHSDLFNPTNKAVFIKIDSYALGDSIAWIPYVEEFRKKHSCRIICSTFHNYLFVDSYPEILFVKPNTVIENVYAQYYLGANNEENLYYSPINYKEHPLQKTGADMLGIPYEEIRPDLSKSFSHIPHEFNGKYVTLSEYGSFEDKSWKTENGWQGVVDFLINKGYKVLVISKEETKLTGVINLTGNRPMEGRIVDILHAEMHFGVSSGLSWLAWSLGTPTVLISDVTPVWHEFKSNVLRICGSDLKEVDYSSENKTSLDFVLKKLEESRVW